ncbi:unnamed protein product [Gongylonema pulchrum]|uniref:Uncharacterized protein n=1 Tax=Gongylonema pulchrum TaxID=637853 RepID=A0A183D9N0_9BILA|nr:unnamed protein product [Gongylonema pulchrum]
MFKIIWLMLFADMIIHSKARTLNSLLDLSSRIRVKRQFSSGGFGQSFSGFSIGPFFSWYQGGSFARRRGFLGGGPWGRRRFWPRRFGGW